MMDRRRFLETLALAAGGLAQARGVPRPSTLTHWTWMRGPTRPMDAWRRRLARLKAAGFDAVLISGSREFFREAVPAAADEGLALHAWFFTMMRGERVRDHADWYAVSRSGKSTAFDPPYVDYYRFMCPSREGVREYLAGLVRDLAQMRGLGSVHLDYIRYPDVILPIALWPKYGLVQDREYPDFDFCYCALCRERFKRQAGVDPADLADPAAYRAWVQYRYDTVTEVVTRLAGVAHEAGTKVTAAVFPTPAVARRLVRQDWTRWPIDAVLPMVYHGFYDEPLAWIGRATREGVVALDGRLPLYTGLYLPDLPPDDLARAADLALAAGASGISVFEASMLTDAHLEALRPILTRAGRRR
ncbi:MAG: hypothetical protein R2752_15560 [Vicinamibacterales bacterium]